MDPQGPQNDGIRTNSAEPPAPLHASIINRQPECTTHPDPIAFQPNSSGSYPVPVSRRPTKPTESSTPNTIGNVDTMRAKGTPMVLGCRPYLRRFLLGTHWSGEAPGTRERTNNGRQKNIRALDINRTDTEIIQLGNTGPPCTTRRKAAW